MSRTANFIGFSRTTVSRFMAAYTKLGKVSSAKQNIGRNSKMTVWNRHMLKRIVIRRCKTILPQIISEMNIHLQNPDPSPRLLTVLQFCVFEQLSGSRHVYLGRSAWTLRLYSAPCSFVQHVITFDTVGLEKRIKLAVQEQDAPVNRAPMIMNF